MTQFGGDKFDASKLPMVLCEEMSQVVMADEQFLQGEGEPQYFKMVGEIIRVMADKSFHYTACPECKKKVLPSDSGHGWRCEKCSKNYDDCNHTYNFSVMLGDFTNAIYA